MRIDVSEEIRNNTFPVQNGYNDTSAVNSSNANTAAGAVFENGVVDKYIEKATEGGSAALDSAESLDSKQMQKQLSMIADTTSEELEQIKEDTDNFEDEEINTIVTVQEKIRMQLAAYCDDFDSGMVEDFSEEELNVISSMKGNAALWAKKLKEANLPVTQKNLESMQYAIELAGKIGEISDGVKAYFVKNQGKDITIESLYLASYSGMGESSVRGGSYYSMQEGGYLAHNSVDNDFENVFAQIEQSLSHEGITIDDNVLQNIKWLYNNQLPINSDTLSRLEEINGISLQADEDKLLDKITDAMYEGDNAADARLNGQSLRDIVQKADGIIDLINKADDEQIKAAIAASDGEITLEDIYNSNNNTAKGSVISDNDIRFVTAKRQLEEIRLTMSVESIAVMEKNGISVDILSLSELVEELKSIENDYKVNYLQAAGAEASPQNIDLFSTVNDAVEAVKNSPAAIIGKAAFADGYGTIAQLEKDGTALSDKYKTAEEAYETVMTKPRADMGDSIKTAFRNVDDILESMNIDVNEYNRRAVRILAYNRMEITPENIDAVKSADLKINNVLSHMTPSAVVKMIRENYNPMEVTIDELDNKLNTYDENSFVTEDKYSEFLWKMEQKNELTSQERESYIGIYRLVNQIEKSDGALVGALVSQGADLTMENLLSAYRSRRKGNVEYSVDDNFNGVESRLTSDISQQIEKGFNKNNNQYYGNLAQKILDNLNNSDITQADGSQNIMDMSLEEFAEFINNAAESDDKYTEYQLDMLRNMNNIEQKVFDIISGYDISNNIGNINAIKDMLASSQNLFKKLYNISENTGTSDADDSDISQMMEQSELLTDSLEDKDSIQQKYSEFIENTVSEIKNAVVDDCDTYVDVRAMKLLGSQLNIASLMSREEMYQIPVMINGEVTAINLKMRHNTGEAQNVNITFNTELTGSIDATFTVKNEQVSGYVVCDSNAGKEYIESTTEQFKSNLNQNANLNISDITVITNSDVNIKDIYIDNSANDAPESKVLYDIAKCFIESVRTTLK